MSPVAWILPLGFIALLPARGPASGTFARKVRPLLEAKCMPCHFEGGTQYAQRPFDRPAVVRALGERLFTRLKDPQDQATLRAFLAEAPDPGPKP